MAALSPRSPALNWKPICICPSVIVSNSQAEHNLAAKFALTRQLSAAVRHQAQVRLPVGTPAAACQPLQGNLKSPRRNETPLGRGPHCCACSLSVRSGAVGANHDSITPRVLS